MSVDFNACGINMNVANRSAAIILFDILGYGRSELELWGELDPADVLRRLATVRESDHVQPASETRGVYVDENGVGEGALCIDFGYSEDRLIRYTTKLQIMAELASERGEQITYG